MFVSLLLVFQFVASIGIISERPSPPCLEVCDISETAATIRFHSEYDSAVYSFRYRRETRNDDDEKENEWIEQVLDSGVDQCTLNGLQLKSNYEVCGKVVTNKVPSSASDIISFETLDHPKKGSNWTEYRGKWISENCGRGYRVIDDRQILFHEGSYKSAKLDMPIEVNPNSESDNIVYWQLTVDGEGEIGLYSMFGVVSNKCNNIGNAVFSGLIDFYGLGCSKLVWDSGTTKSSKDFPKIKQSYVAKVGSKGISCGEIIKIGLYQRSSKLVFLREEKELWTIQLPERTAWYPCIALGCGKFNYYVKLVPLSEDK